MSYPPALIKGVYPSLYWQIPTAEDEIFITFDDGPTAGVTNAALELLKAYKAKATFFCIGKNVAKKPELYQQIMAEGHAVGNHTYDHMNGWKNTNETYYHNIQACEELFQSQLFRPPYGRIKPAQIRKLSKQYKIIMWSTLSMDYNPKFSPEECLSLSISKLKRGSIIVFHDSEKAKDRMLYALEGLLNYAGENQLKCSSIKLPLETA